MGVQPSRARWRVTHEGAFCCRATKASSHPSHIGHCSPKMHLPRPQQCLWHGRGASEVLNNARRPPCGATRGGAAGRKWLRCQPHSARGCRARSARPTPAPGSSAAHLEPCHSRGWRGPCPTPRPGRIQGKWAAAGPACSPTSTCPCCHWGWARRGATPTGLQAAEPVGAVARTGGKWRRASPGCRGAGALPLAPTSRVGGRVGKGSRGRRAGKGAARVAGPGHGAARQAARPGAARRAAAASVFWEAGLGIIGAACKRQKGEAAVRTELGSQGMSVASFGRAGGKLHSVRCCCTRIQAEPSPTPTWRGVAPCLWRPLLCRLLRLLRRSLCLLWLLLRQRRGW